MIVAEGPARGVRAAWEGADRRALAMGAALLAVAIFALFLLQSVFVALRGTLPEVAALHPLNGFLITFLAIVLARDAWLARRAPRGQAPAPAGPEFGASIR